MPCDPKIEYAHIEGQRRVQKQSRGFPSVIAQHLYRSSVPVHPKELGEPGPAKDKGDGGEEKPPELSRQGNPQPPQPPRGEAPAVGARRGAVDYAAQARAAFALYVLSPPLHQEPGKAVSHLFYLHGILGREGGKALTRHSPGRTSGRSRGRTACGSGTRGAGSGAARATPP